MGSKAKDKAPEGVTPFGAFSAPLALFSREPDHHGDRLLYEVQHPPPGVQIRAVCVPWSGWRTHSAVFCH